LLFTGRMNAHKSLHLGSSVFAAMLAAVLGTGCVVGGEEQDASQVSDPAETPMTNEADEAVEIGGDLRGVHDLSPGDDHEVTIVASEYGELLSNIAFNSSVYTTGSDYRRWRVYQGVTGNSVARSWETAYGYGLKLNCIDLCIAKQRVPAQANTYYTLHAGWHGYNDGSPRQRVAIWFYDLELRWLGGKYFYIEEDGGTLNGFELAAKSPANTSYMAVEIMYDSSTNERSRYFYDYAGVLLGD
jgi:hypothetical protein